MDFPRDHRWHDGVGYEWFYFWGRRPNGTFYHHAEFRIKDKGEFTHHSEGDELGEIRTTSPTIQLARANPIVIHQSADLGSYYTIPGNPWFDHVWGPTVGDNWDWVGLNLDCGIAIMCLDKPDSRIGDISIGEKVIYTDFTLDNKRLNIKATGMNLILEPLKQEVVFKPKFGRPYSETPVEVVAHGQVIGYGMRERTYKGSV